MFKVILSAVVAMGMGSVAFANDAAAPTGATTTTTTTQEPAHATTPDAAAPKAAAKKKAPHAAHGMKKTEKKETVTEPAAN